MEWLSYSLADLQAFSKETFFRQFHILNATVWPLHIVAMTSGRLLPWLARKPSPARDRTIAVLLALAWIVVAMGYHATYYAQIHWAATWFAVLFLAQGGLLILDGAALNNLRFRRRKHWGDRLGVGLVIFAVFVHPLTGWLSGRSWSELAVFGIAPDPTALATLGLIPLIAGRRRWELTILPLAWCGIGGLGALSIGAPSEAAVLALGALVGLVALAAPREPGTPPAAPSAGHAEHANKS